MPAGLEVDLEALKAGLNAAAEGYGKVAQVEERPIAFGLKAVMFSVVMPDKTGKPDDLEAALGKVEGVESVETDSLTLI